MNQGRVSRLAGTGFLTLALLIAPLLGLMHGLVHGVQFDEHVVHLAQLSTDEGDAHDQGHAHDHDVQPGANWLSDLFSAHADDADCRVFDQLCHGDASPALPLLALPTVLTPLGLVFLQGEVIARWAALFEARGPPLTR